MGKYVVDVMSFEALALPAIQPGNPATRLVVIDELGEECTNPQWQRQPNSAEGIA